MRTRARRKSLRAGLRKFEANQPFAGNTPLIYLWRRKGPIARGLLGKAGEIFAWTGTVEFRMRHRAGRVHVRADSDTNGAMDCGECLCRNPRENLV